MNAKMFWAGATLAAGLNSFGDFARGNFSNWANGCPLTQTGDYCSGTLYDNL